MFRSPSQSLIDEDTLPRPIVPTQPVPIWSLLLTALLLELLLLWLNLQSLLPALHLNATPLSTAWPWNTLLAMPALNTLLAASNHFATPLFGLNLIALMGVYAFALWRIRHHPTPSAHATRWLLLLMAGALLFGLTLWLQPALFSGEIFNALFAGRITAIYHQDPLLAIPTQFSTDPLLPWVPNSSQPTIYGPLWLLISNLLTRLSGSPLQVLLLSKGLILFTHLLNCLLIWAILARIAPGRRLLGTLIYAWNPLVLLELAGNGQQEGLLLTLLLLGTLLHVRGRGRGAQAGTLLLFGLAGALNLSVLLFVPLYIWFLLRGTHEPVAITLGVIWRGLLSLAVIVLLYLPFWHGLSSYQALISATDWGYFQHSPLATLTAPMRRLFKFFAVIIHFRRDIEPVTAADFTLRGAALFIFGMIYLRLLNRVRQAPIDTHASSQRDPLATRPADLEALFMVWTSAGFWFLALLAGWFWPWYVLWILWVVALRKLDTLSVAMLLFSGTSFLLYPLLNFDPSSITAYQGLLIFSLPFVYLIIHALQNRRSTFKEAHATS